MDEQVRSELVELIKSGGRNLCTMPRMLGIMLRQRCPDAEAAVRELEDALEAGCVRPIMAATGPVDEPPLVDELVSQTGMARDRAEWVIESWVRALDAGDVPQEMSRDWAEWNKLDVSKETAGGVGIYQRAVWHLVFVALAGAAGGTIFGLYVLLAGDRMSASPWADALEEVEPWMRVPALMALGVLGGFAGGLFGWIVGGGRSWTYDAHGGTTLGRLVFSATGAFHGAVIGALPLTMLVGLIGVMAGSLVGAALGAFLGLLSAEAASRFWYWW